MPASTFINVQAVGRRCGPSQVTAACSAPTALFPAHPFRCSGVVAGDLFPRRDVVPKGRESEMPPREMWEGFFEPDGVLQALACSDLPGDIVEFGYGYGTFTVAAALRVSGIVYASDIDPSMVSATIDCAAQAGVRNVVVETRDFVTEGCGRPDASVIYVMLFNILHIEDPVSLLREAHRVLRVGGIVGVIHWRKDIETPRGPSLEFRPRPAQCRAWAEQAGLHWLSAPDLPSSPWHWGMVFGRPA
jgi:SAM-dependent methyltransferase